MANSQEIAWTVLAVRCEYSGASVARSRETTGENFVITMVFTIATFSEGSQQQHNKYHYRL